MKYASESAGPMTSVHQWKPVIPDRFIALLHFYSTALADQHGHEAISTTAMVLDRDATATIYYRRKEPDSPVSSPVLMTMEGPGGKTLCFETTNTDFALEPRPAGVVIAASGAARDMRDAALIAQAAATAAMSEDVVVVVATKLPNDQISRALHEAGKSPSQIRFSTPLDLKERIRGLRNIGFWIHDAGHLGYAPLRELMEAIAIESRGEGWMAMTGHRPTGWPSPEGLPKLRV